MWALFESTGRVTACAALLTLFPARPAAAQASVATAPAAEASVGDVPAAGVPADKSQPGNDVEIVVTGTRTPEQSLRATVSTGVVGHAEAARRGATNVGEALAGEPGLQVNPNAYSHVGSPAGVQIQGLDADRVLVLRDGERVIGDFGGVIDLSGFALNDVDRIEYVAGPSSSLYGTGALGGVVNIVSRPPSVLGPSARLQLQARSQPSFSAAGTGAYRSDANWAALDLSHRANEGVRLFEDRQDWAVAPAQQTAVGLRLGREDTHLDSTVRGSYSHETARGLVTQEVPGLRPFLVDLPDKTQRFSVYNLERYRFAGGSQLQSSLGGQWFHNRADKDRQASPLDERRRREQSLLTAELTATLADGERTWVMGGRVEREAFQQRLEQVTSSAGELVTHGTQEVAPVHFTTAAAYAQLSWKLPGELVLVPGVRVEHHSRFGAVVAPRLSAAWFATPRVRLRASAGTGFRAPSAKEYGFFFDHSFLGYRVLGNPELKPERSIGANGELGVQASRQWSLKVAGFYNWIQELITTEYRGQELLGVDDYAYTNVGRARTAGFELAATWRVGPRLRSQLAYDFLFTRDDGTGQPLPSRPPHTLLAALYCQPLTDLELSYRQRFVSAAFVAPGLSAPGAIVLDARVAYRLWSQLRVHAGVMNALDSRQDPLRPADERSLLGRLWLVGLEVSTPSEELYQ